jgi:hypothetical protein
VQTQLDLTQSQLDKAEARVKELEKENNRVIREAEDEGKKVGGEGVICMGMFSVSSEPHTGCGVVLYAPLPCLFSTY